MIQIECFPIEDPCQQICRFNRQHICKICHRKREEKRQWAHYTEQEKRAVLRKCHWRKIAFRRMERQLMLHPVKSKPVQQLSLFDANYPPSPNSQPAKTTRPTTTDKSDNPQLSLFGD